MQPCSTWDVARATQAFAVAPHAASVTAYDLTAQMLAVVEREAEARKLPNITTVQGMAEELPFPDAHFDCVISRYSAHHWHDVTAALREVRRVLKPEGRALMIDTAGGETPLLDTHLQAVEILRDPSHIRNYSTREWLALFREAGFTATVRKEWPVRSNSLAGSNGSARRRNGSRRFMQYGVPRRMRCAVSLKCSRTAPLPCKRY